MQELILASANTCEVKGHYYTRDKLLYGTDKVLGFR